MEPPPSSLDSPTKEIANIARDLQTESEQYLFVRNHNPSSNLLLSPQSYVVVDSPSPIGQHRSSTSSQLAPSPSYQLASVHIGSPPSVLAAVPSPMSVADSTYPNTPIMMNTNNNGGAWLPSPVPAGAFINAVQLLIIEQPVERCRFRYRAEHSPHGALRGADKRQKSCPKVKVENFKGRGYILATLYTNEEIPRPHVNELWGWTNNCADGKCRADLDANMSAMFPNLGIMRQKESDIKELLYKKYLKEYNEQGWSVTDDVRESLNEKSQREMATMKDCLHCVRLGFQAFLFDDSNGVSQEFSTPIVLSSPIFNSQNTGHSELKIADIDKSCGQAIGGDRIWIRCAAKIRREHIKIIFHDPNTGWEAEGVFASGDVFEQILIIFKTPAYQDVNITERVHVNLHLLRTSDNTYSPAMDFVYLPMDDGPSAKRQRRNIPAYGPSGFGFFPDQSPSTSTGSPSGQRASSSEFDAYTPGTTGGGGVRQLQQRSGPFAQHGRQPSIRPRELDSGIALDPSSMATADSPSSASSMPAPSAPAPPMMTTLVSDVRSRIETLSLAELNRLGGLGEATKMQSYLTGLWETHVRALWCFSAEGDSEPFVAACKGLIGLQDENGNTAIHTAVKNKQSFALKTMLKVLDTLPNKREILDERNFKRQTALHLAIRYGDDDCVHYLITAGTDRTAIDADGRTVAHYLAETFNEDIYRDILFPPNESIECRQKIDLVQMNDEGETAVHLAVKRKKLALLETLLDAQAPVNDVERNTGKSALHLAVEAGDTDAVDLLLRNRASVSLQSYDGTTPLQLATKLKSIPIIAKLIAAKADPHEKTSSMTLNSDDIDGDEDGLRTTAAKQDETEDDGEPLDGEGVELYSAMDYAEDDPDTIEYLKGKPYVPPSPTPDDSMSGGDVSPSVGGGPPSIAFGGARPKTSQYVSSSTSNKHSLAPPSSSGSGRASPAAATGACATEVAACSSEHAVRWSPSVRRRLPSSSSSGSPEPLPAFINDDLSTLDYVTRVRLGKLLDEAGRWEQLARSLESEHMIDLLKVIHEADGTSPTILLLDQLERTPGSSITRLLNSLREAGHKSAVDMVLRKQRENQQGGSSGGAGGRVEGASGETEDMDSGL